MPHCIPIRSYLESFCCVQTLTLDQHTDLHNDCSTSQDVKDYTSLLGWLQEPSPLLYTAHDALVSVSTGVVADKSANPDKVYTIGIDLAANENISVRGRNVEVKNELLFLRVTCVLKDQNEMKKHLKHEFMNKSFFEKGVMRKNTKSTCSCWCIEVKCHSIVCSSPKLILRHRWCTVVIYRINWSTGYTYDQVCDIYVRHALKKLNWGHSDIWWIQGSHVNQNNWAAAKGHTEQLPWYYLWARPDSFYTSESFSG